jgi:hypothetical protein
LIEIYLEKVVAICYEGDNLIDEPQPCYVNLSHKNGMQNSYIEHYSKFYENLYAHNIIGYIRKHDVIIY